jgi:hypothetical protein
MEETTSKRNYNNSLIIMLFCIFCFTVGQFLPIYFADTGFRATYYFIICILLIASSSLTVFKLIYKPQKNNISSARLFSILTAFATFIIFGLWTLGLLFSVWSEAFTYYVRKDNAKIKIISRYINQGAFGGGTEKEDYHIVLTRPFLSFFKMETSIDTLNIKKEEWKKPEIYNFEVIKGKWYAYKGSTPYRVLTFGDTTVSVQNNDTSYKLNYLISFDSLYMWQNKTNLKISSKILSLEKDGFMVEDSNEVRGVRNYFRHQE